jgi:hypothetical protein
MGKMASRGRNSFEIIHWKILQKEMSIDSTSLLHPAIFAITLRDDVLEVIPGASRV